MGAGGRGRVPPTLAVGAVVLDESGRLLVVRRARPPAADRWSLPGGRLEEDETLSAALRREVREETGLDIDVGEVVGAVERRGPGHHYVIIDFRAEVVGGSLAAGDDAAEVAWMGRGDLEAVTTTDGLLPFLDEHGVELAP